MSGNGSQGMSVSLDQFRRQDDSENDSDTSWHPNQEVRDMSELENESETAINKNQLFLASLGALMSLFT